MIFKIIFMCITIAMGGVIGYTYVKNDWKYTWGFFIGMIVGAILFGL